MSVREPSSYLNKNMNEHLVLLHDDPEALKKHEYEFLKTNLENNKNCVFITRRRIDNVEEEMILHGIDVEKNKKLNLIHFFNIPIIPDGDNVLREFEKIQHKMFEGLLAPFCVIVDSAFCDVRTTEGMLGELEIERNLHSSFHDFPGSVLCCYSFDEIAASNVADALKIIIDNHHGLLFTPDPDSGIAFKIE